MLDRKEICLEKDKLESKINPKFLAEEVGEMGYMKGRESDGLMSLEVCCGSSIRRNSVLEGLRMRLLDDIHDTVWHGTCNTVTWCV